MTPGDEVTLREFMQSQIAGLKEYIVKQHESDEKALQLANRDILHRLEEQNEFRKQLDTERAEYVKREMLRKELEAIDTKIETQAKTIKSLETVKAFTEGKMWMVMAGFAAIPTIIAIMAFFKG